MYIDSSIRTYLDDLAAKKPAPGGGSAAALAASIGTSLMSMVANYTVGRPKYKDVEAEVSGMIEDIRRFDSELRALVDEDVEAYGRLSAALKKAGGSGPVSDEIFKEAIKPPIRVCEISARCLKLCGRLAECGNSNLVTDTAIAAILLEGAFFSAKYNVYINLASIKDNAYIAKIHDVLLPLEEEMPRLKEEILEKCEEVIRGS